ncbi:MAG: hypothetical protein NT013_15340, partial [Planctomycetia bacterium]|nr:hypothetical protein [Planctomycetia bacterium]
MESEQGPNARRDYICKMSRLGKTLVGFFESWSTLANAGAEYMVLLVQLLPRGWCKHSARTCRHFSRLVPRPRNNLPLDLECGLLDFCGAGDAPVRWAEPSYGLRLCRFAGV